jgi:hypothetical protein
MSRSLNLNGLWKASAPPCLEVGVPLIGAVSGLSVGYEYDFPILPFFSPNPPDSRNPTSIGAGPSLVATPWIDNSAIDLTTVISPWTNVDIGTQTVAIWANNCFGTGRPGGGAESSASVQTSGWVTGEPRALVGAGFMEIETPVYNFATMVAWQADTTSLVVRATGGGTIYYTGAYGATMNSAAFTCDDLGSPVLDFIFTNATGSITLSQVLYIQDNMGACP